MEPNLTALRHADLRDLLGAYALGAVDAEEAAAVREHLATCAECQAEMAALWAAVDALPEMVEPMEPAPVLRERIAAAVVAEGLQPQPAVSPRPPTPLSQRAGRGGTVPPSEAWWSRATPWMAAAAVLLLVSAGLIVWNLRLRNQIETAVPQTVALEATDAAPGASGEVRFDPDSDVLVLDVRDLPPLAEGEVYEVWLIGAEGPVPAGVFDQSTDQHAIVAERGQFETLAITNEPGPLGTAEPTGEIVATAAL